MEACAISCVANEDHNPFFQMQPSLRAGLILRNANKRLGFSTLFGIQYATIQPILLQVINDASYWLIHRNRGKPGDPGVEENGQKEPFQPCMDFCCFFHNHTVFQYENLEGQKVLS